MEEYRQYLYVSIVNFLFPSQGRPTSHLRDHKNGKKVNVADNNLGLELRKLDLNPFFSCTSSNK